MMTSLNGNNFRVTGSLWEDPLTKASNAELSGFLWFAPEEKGEQTFETPVIWDAIVLTMMSL